MLLWDFVKWIINIQIMKTVIHAVLQKIKRLSTSAVLKQPYVVLKGLEHRNVCVQNSVQGLLSPYCCYISEKHSL